MKYGSLPHSIRRALAAEAGIDLDLEPSGEVDQPIGEVIALRPVDHHEAMPRGDEAA